MSARAPRRARSKSRHGGLTRRIVLASGIVMLFAIGAYALLFSVIIDLNDSVGVAHRTRAVLASVNRLERLVTDVDTDIREFIITGDRRLLAPLGHEQDDALAEGRNLERLTAQSEPRQAVRGRRLAQDSEAYIRDYSIPLVVSARQDPNSARSPATIREDEQRLQRLRTEFDTFTSNEHHLLVSEEKQSSVDAADATLIAAGGAGGALLLLLFFSGYLSHAVLRPIRRTSAMASDLADYNLLARIPEVSRNDVGVLERTFNVMARSLQADRAQLRRVVAEQGALRRIAMLVARGVSPAEIFAAAASEVGRIHEMEHTVINRFDVAGVVTVGHWSAPDAPGILPPLGGHWPVEAESAAGEIVRTGRPARVNTDRITSVIGAWFRENGIRYVIGCPIMVGGHLWGMISVFSASGEPPPDDTEERLLEFVQLLATAIANVENRNELLDSSARIIAASDEARWRIERKLNTGPRPCLMALGEELRLTQATIAPDRKELKEHLAMSVKGVDSVLDDLREISRGLHPAALSRGGLRLALEALTQRSEVPADLIMRVDRHLPDHIQVAIYYTVSEALTNVAKYARAGKVRIELVLAAKMLKLRVTDDGIGGADPTGGSGLIGLKDRVEALDGTITVVSPFGGGTSLLVDIPIAGE